ncbi:carboxypeptidase regulatory-like domain-containing protein [Paenibacillus sp. WLX2291]|uniref:carboxypeptidase regulatory-like domain-containing protein n=1 Tax=Paenibacillus sp. WLX2291 TaxID=3296934 RepID=UPI0039842ED9
MKSWTQTNRQIRKSIFVLLASLLMTSSITTGKVQAEDIETSNLYSSVVTKAGNDTIKQLGESIRSDAANAQVITPDPGQVTGKIYYIAVDGSTSNNGLSQARPWPIEKVNATTFKPGDHILFKAGDSWKLTESIHPKGSGTASKPIVIGAYGSGAKPKFSAIDIGVPWKFTDGSTRYASDALYLENQQYIEIRDLDISSKPAGYTGAVSSSQAAMRADRRGIHIVGGNNKTATELKGYSLHDLYIHDVVGETNGVSGTGWDPSKRTAGILFEIIVKGDNGLPVISNSVDVSGYQPTWFSDVTMENNVLIDNSFGGIIVKQLKAWGERQDASAPSYDYDGWYPNRNVTIQNNYVDNDGSNYAGDTIYLTCTKDSVIRHNVSRGAGTSAIELYYTDNITVEWNEVFKAREKQVGGDSNAIDPDRASTNALIQYNYLYDNGDGILLCGFTYGSAVVRYNVIKDSGKGKRYLNVHGVKGHNYVYNNIFYNSGTSEAIFVSTSGDKNSYLNDTNNFHYFSNNIFYSPRASARIDDGTSLDFSNNGYYNVSSVPVEDTSAIIADPQFKDAASVTGGVGKTASISGLQLQPQSLFINAGKTIATDTKGAHPNTTIPVGTIKDVAGKSISAGGVDLGIYEYVGTDNSVGYLRGYTYDPYGKVKAGVTVTAKAGSKVYTATSDANGFYFLSNIPIATDPTVTASLQNYASSTPKSIHLLGGDVTSLNSTLGASTATTGTISGTTNIADVTIIVTDKNGASIGKATTGADGTYTIANVPVGTGYTATASKTNFNNAVQNAIEVQADHITVVNFTMSQVVKELHYFLKENFNYATGNFAGNDIWNASNAGGTIEIVADKQGSKYLKLNKTANTNDVKIWNKTPLQAKGIFTIESRIMRTADNGSGASQFAIYSGEGISSSGVISNSMANVGFSRSNLFIQATQGSSNNTNYTYSKNQWYTTKMVVDMDTDTFDFYIDGVLKKSGAQLRTVGDALNYFQIFGGANNVGDLLIDYLWVYQGEPTTNDVQVTNVTVDELGDSPLAYNASTRTFTADSEIPYQYDTVKMHITPSSPFAKVSVNGIELDRVDDAEYVDVPVAAGTNTIKFTVTGADGSTSQTYTISLEKQDSSVLAYLTALRISGLTLDPEFDGTDPEESVAVYSAGTTTEATHTLSYTKVNSNSTVVVTLNGTQVSGESPVSLTLAPGDNTILLDVTGDGEFQTYQITATLQ